MFLHILFLQNMWIFLPLFPLFSMHLFYAILVDRNVGEKPFFLNRCLRIAPLRSSSGIIVSYNEANYNDRIPKEHIPAERELNDLAEFFKVFGDVTRLKLLSVLFHSEMCVCDLSKTLNMSQSAISHQLRILKQMKLVKNRREGKTVFYSLADGHIKTIINQGMEHIQE